MRILVTYHPASTLYARAQGAGTGPTKESLIKAIREDIARAAEGSTPPLPPPAPGLPFAPTLAFDTEYLGDILLSVGVSDGTLAFVWDRELGALESSQKETEKEKQVITSSQESIIAPGGAACQAQNETANESAGFLSPTVSPISAVLSQARVLIGHNIAEDLRFVWEAGLIPKREGFLRGEGLVDTLPLAKMVYEARASYKLEDLLASLFTIQGWKAATKKDPTLWTAQERVDRCARDAWGTYHIAANQWPQVNVPLYQFTQAYAMVLHRMTLAGAIIDKSYYGELVATAEQERNLLHVKLKAIGNRLGNPDFDPQNDTHLRKVLYNILALPILEKTKKEKLPSVARSTLEALAEQTEGQTKGLLDALVTFSKIDKVYSTYSGGLSPPIRWVDLEGVGEVGWLPFRFKVLGARTGRRSSGKEAADHHERGSYVNSQNWPTDVRRMVRSRWDRGVILECDYKNLEPRIIAFLAKEPKLLEFFVHGGGYLDVAQTLLGVTVTKGTPRYTATKAIVLAIHYGAETEEIAKNLWEEGIRFSPDWDTHWAETDRLRLLYLDTFPGIRSYMSRCKAYLAAHGFVRTPTGRVLHVGGEGKHSDNQAINGPVQGTAGDVTGAALIDVEAMVLAEAGLSLVDWFDGLCASRKKFLTGPVAGGIIRVLPRIPTLFNEVHDSLLLDLPPEWAERGVELVVETMRAVPTLRALCPFLKDLPLDVDVKKGPRWGN